MPTSRSPAPPDAPLAALAACMLLSSFAGASAGVALPALQAAFTAPLSQVRWVVLAYLIGLAALVLFAGRLGDLAGRRRLLLGGLALYCGGAAACACAPTLPLLVAARMLQGAGAAVMLALPLALAGGGGAGRGVGRAMGLLGSMSAAGTALGPALGGLLVAHGGWRAIFVASFALGAGALWLAARILPTDPPRPEQAGASLLPAGLLRAPGTAAGCACGALTMVPMAATLLVGPFYLTRVLGMDVDGAGLALAAGPVGATLAGLPAGRLVERWGPDRAVGAGLATMALGSAALALLAGRTGSDSYVGALLLLTAGYALAQAANNTAVMGGVDSRDRGAAGGLLGLARNLGALAGTALVSNWLAWGAATPDLAGAAPAAVAAGTRLAFGLAATAPLAALALLGAARARSGARVGG